MNAVAQAMKKDPQLDKLDSFNERWDFSRFACLVENMGKCLFPNHKEVLNALQRCRDMRNSVSHSDHCGSDTIGKDDDELMLFIIDARKHIPQINGLSRRESRHLKRKLKDLQRCLFHDEDNEVSS